MFRDTLIRDTTSLPSTKVFDVPVYFKAPVKDLSSWQYGTIVTSTSENASPYLSRPPCITSCVNAPPQMHHTVLAHNNVHNTLFSPAGSNSFCQDPRILCLFSGSMPWNNYLTGQKRKIFAAFKKYWRGLQDRTSSCVNTIVTIVHAKNIYSTKNGMAVKYLTVPRRREI